MKFLVFFIVVCLATVYGDKMPEKKGHKVNPEMKNWSEECAQANNINLAAFKPKKGEKHEKKEVSKDMKCYKRCVAIKSGFFNETGEEVIYEKVQKTFKLDDAKMEEIMNCTSNAEDKCEYFYEISTCGMKLLPKPKFGGKGPLNQCPEMKKYAEECAKEHNIKFNSSKMFNHENFDRKNVTNNYKCFKRCIAIKAKFIDEEGKPNYEKIKENFKLNDKKIEEIKKCTSTAEDKCDNYYEIHTCSIKAAIKDIKQKGDKKGKKEQ